MTEKTQYLNSFGAANETGKTKSVRKAKAAKSTNVPAKIGEEGAVAVKNSISDGKGTYDVNFSTIFKEPEVIAAMVKNLIPAYKDCSTASIRQMIGTVRTNKEVSPGRANIQSTVSKVEGETTVYYDVFTTIRLPDWLASIFLEIHTDFEMQRVDTPRYVLPRRGVYYAARMISDQLPSVRKNSDYGKINPVYSIWIVLTKSEEMKNKVVRYGITNKTSETNIKSTKDKNSYAQELDENTDLINIIYIFLDKEIKHEDDYNQNLDDVVEFLIMLFTDDLHNAKMREKYLDFSIIDNEDWYEEVEKMSDWMKAIQESKEEGREEGREEGKAESVFNLMKNCHFTIDEAMQAIGVTSDEWDSVQTAVEELEDYDF